MWKRKQKQDPPAADDGDAASELDLDSVSRWVHDLKTDDDKEEPTRRLWDRYFERLVAMASRRMPNERVVDGEDVAAAAMNSFFKRASEEDGFRKLYNREDVWQLLTVIVTRKIVDNIEHEHRKKRGGGTVVGEEVLVRRWATERGRDGLSLVVGNDPTPDMAAEVADEVQHLLELLSDEELQSVAEWKTAGYSNAEIGEKLDRSERTVERYLSTIRARWKTIVE